MGTAKPRATRLPRWRRRLHDIIFEADTPAGRAFDLALLMAISLSVIAVCLESVPSLQAKHGGWLRNAEWVFTGLFALEYVLRILAVQRPLRYMTSFFGVVDLIAVLPAAVSLFFPGTQSLAVVRSLRLMRVFRVLKLAGSRIEVRESLAQLDHRRRLGDIRLGHDEPVCDRRLLDRLREAVERAHAVDSVDGRHHAVVPVQSSTSSKRRSKSLGLKVIVRGN